MKVSLRISTEAAVSEVIMEPDALNNLSNYIRGYSKVFLIADREVTKHWLGSVTSLLPQDLELIEIDGGDEQKNLDLFANILKTIRERGGDRQSLIIGFGGGVVSDLAGFVAATYMRGVSWVAIPTTLAAQADAAIGGKTGVNLNNYKNMVGSFWPPKAVLVDSKFLQTLGKRELISGLGEIIKMGFIYDKNILKLIDKIEPSELLGSKLQEAATLAAVGKVDIVNQDLYESAERKLLNFGHTIGHAIETLSFEDNRRLLHGEAISIGMVAEARLAELETICETGLASTVESTLQRFGLPTKAEGANIDKISQKILSDKKNSGGKILWTLPSGIGQGVFNHKARPENIQAAIKSICD